jgi:hypothetical protein
MTNTNHDFFIMFCTLEEHCMHHNGFACHVICKGKTFDLLSLIMAIMKIQSYIWIIKGDLLIEARYGLSSNFGDMNRFLAPFTLFAFGAFGLGIGFDSSVGCTVFVAVVVVVVVVLLCIC